MILMFMNVCRPLFECLLATFDQYYLPLRKQLEIDDSYTQLEVVLTYIQVPISDFLTWLALLQLFYHQTRK